MELDRTPCERAGHEARECACFGITRALSADEDLPAHVSVGAMIRSCELWAETFPQGGIVRNACLPLPDGRQVLTGNSGPLDWPWPLLWDTAALLLVLRRWVQEPANERLALEMKQRPEWKQLQCLRGWGAWQNRPGGIGGGPLNWTAAEELLIEVGLPATPNTVQFVLQELEPDLFPELVDGPSRGILLRSFLVLPFGFDGQPRTHPQLLTQPVALTAWTTGDLWSEVADTGRKQLEWWTDVVERDAIRGRSELRDMAYCAAFVFDHLAGIERPALRTFNGRRADPLEEIVRRCLSGEITRTGMHEAALHLERTTLGRTLQPREAAQVKRKADARLYRRSSAPAPGAQEGG